MRFSIRHTGFRPCDQIFIKAFLIDLNRPDRPGKRIDLHTKFPEEFGCDGAGRNPTGRLSGTCAPASAVVAEAVFGVISVISVSGSETVFQITVVSGSLGSIADQKRNWCSRSFSIKNAGQDLNCVRFFSGS